MPTRAPSHRLVDVGDGLEAVRFAFASGQPSLLPIYGQLLPIDGQLELEGREFTNINHGRPSVAGGSTRAT